MSILLDPPPVRTGHCGLVLRINGRRYDLRYHAVSPRHKRVFSWH
jgi:hypothetical protein